MPIGIENRDSSFFTVESPDIKLTQKEFSNNLLSLTIIERTNAMPQGTLAFYDPDFRFSRILRTGVSLVLSWGYRNLNETPDSLLANKLNTDEISGSLIRRGLRGFVSSPSGEGGADGVVRYNCNFTAYGFRGDKQSKLFTEGTKASVISQAFDDLGISPAKRLIDFSLGTDVVTPDKAVRQDETTFLFLTRLAKEWRTLFQVGFSPIGEPIAIFIDPNKIIDNNYPRWALGAIGKSNVIGYKGKLNNVKSYKWKSNESESGVGDNVRLDIINGKIVFRRFVAEQEKVVSYRLNEEAIQKVFKDAGDLQSQTELLTELLSKKDFESIKHFFVPVTTTTAPQGFGYRINCEMIGNPLYTPPNQIVINNGFPDRLGGKEAIYYLNTVTHRIDRSGYNMSVEIIDVFTLSPIGLPVR